MKIKTIFIAGAGLLAAVVMVGYGYVFVAGAPQLDAPQIASAQTTDLTFQMETFQSQAMGTARDYGVILPPDYERSPQKRYPVIFLLHGGHDDGRSFYDKYAITDVLHELYQARKLLPAIVIMPDGNDNRGSSPLWDPQYFNGERGNLDTLIGTELVNVVKSRYRTLAEPKNWAIGGVSSGGWGSMNIGLRHLDTFSTLFSHSGYFTDQSGPQNSPLAFIGSLPSAQLKTLHVYMDAGDNAEDEFFRTSSQAFHQKLNQLDVSNVLNIFPGGHGFTGEDVGWNYFHKHLADSLSYVGQQFGH